MKLSCHTIFFCGLPLLISTLLSKWV
jgi:hypothetical protein